VSAGPPQTDCFTAIVEDITDNMNAAIAMLITAFVLLLAQFGVFPLCTKDSKEEEDKVEVFQVDEANKMH